MVPSPAPHGTMSVSLIIPTYRREELLVQTLQCALKQDMDDYEIIVVDQTPQHTEEVEKFFRANRTRVSRVCLPTPSLTAARNVGIRHAKGEILVWVDDDTTFGSDFLQQHIAAHKTGAHVVQGRVLEEGSRVTGKPISVSWRLKFTGSNTCLSDGQINTITGCNFSFRREVVDTIGFFDERYQGLATREDSDFGVRASRAGLPMVFAPKAVVYHHRSNVGGVADSVKEQFFDRSYYTCELLFARRHFAPAVVRVYKLRLLLRGIKQLRKLIAGADREVSSLLRDTTRNAHENQTQTSENANQIPSN